MTTHNDIFRGADSEKRFNKFFVRFSWFAFSTVARFILYRVVLNAVLPCNSLLPCSSTEAEFHMSE